MIVEGSEESVVIFHVEYVNKSILTGSCKKVKSRKRVRVVNTGDLRLVRLDQNNLSAIKLTKPF